MKKLSRFSAVRGAVKIPKNINRRKNSAAKLAEAGFTICTGGYLGVMEAASRGAREKGGRVLGIVMNQFRSEPNRYLTDKVATNHFYERLQNLIERSIGFVAFRGGMGTVTEISLVWNKLQTRVINPRPLVLLGDCWKPFIKACQENLVVSNTDVSILGFCLECRRSLSNHYRKIRRSFMYELPEM